MRCEDALYYWQQALLGQPVDQPTLEEAHAHIRTCQDLCARTLSASPDFDLLSNPEQRSGQTDLYEALGLSAEEEGDAHARQWARLKRLMPTGRATQEAIDHERAMALAAWQSAANYYADGLRIGTTAFLSEGLKRIEQKRLAPAAPAARLTQTGPRPHTSRATRSTTPDRPAPPGEPTPPRLPLEAWPLLTLVSHAATRQITLGERTAGWHISGIRPDAALALREPSSAYPTSPQDTAEAAASAPEVVDGTLDPFALVLQAAEDGQRWEIDLLVRASSARDPWSSIVLTLEDDAGHFSRPTLLAFAQRERGLTGWWARVPDVDPGDYRLHLSANDSSGQAAESATLALHLVSEDTSS